VRQRSQRGPLIGLQLPSGIYLTLKPCRQSVPLPVRGPSFGHGLACFFEVFGFQAAELRFESQPEAFLRAAVPCCVDRLPSASYCQRWLGGQPPSEPVALDPVRGMRVSSLCVCLAVPVMSR
jgi:hypothetical protein